MIVFNLFWSGFRAMPGEIKQCLKILNKRMTDSVDREERKRQEKGK